MSKGDDPGVVRTVRFSTAQWARVVAEAERLHMPVSTFVRTCVLQAVGLVNEEELTHVRRVIAIRHVKDSLARAGKPLEAPAPAADGK